MSSEPARLYPLLLEVSGREALVVGGGAVATRRAEGLLDSGARVHVVAPWVSARITELAAAGRLSVHRREFEPADLAAAWVVCTATGHREVDGAVARLCEQRRIWCVRASDPAAGSARTPAVVRGDDGVCVAVSGGGDPGRAIAIRDVIAVLLRAGTLPTERVRGQRRPPAGRVILVGAGPGDPELITVRAARALAVADVIVTDRLAPKSLLAQVPAGVEVIDVGKSPGRHASSQDQINAVLVDRAQAGRTVVRLKGGDPFVLGRGGEEVAACTQAGIPVEVVPGITSAIAVPEAAGIPVTQRGITTSVVIASAHDGIPGIQAAAAGAPRTATIVLLMGAGKLREAATALLADGRDPGTAVAVIGSGWTPEQHTVTATLGALADGAGADVRAPVVTVIGEVAALRDHWGDLANPSPAAGHARR